MLPNGVVVAAVVLGVTFMPAAGHAHTKVSTRPTTQLATPLAEGRSGKKLAMFVENWLECPSTEQIQGYTHVIISFAVSYTWSPGKNQCSDTCQISTPAICDNAPNADLVNAWRAAGVQVILSFGGAGMGGSWDGDNNDCWESCFGRVPSIVTQLTAIVEAQNFDGVDIDYEYFLTDDAQTFLEDLTTQLKTALPAGKTVSHAPMDGDLDKGDPYYDVIQKVAGSVDYVLPQYYNGPFRPANDLGPVIPHIRDLVDVFHGDESKIVFGFCATDCASTGSNIDGSKAKDVMSKVIEEFPDIGGAYCWASAADRSHEWSAPLRNYFGSLGSGPTSAPTSAPTLGPTSAPTPAPTSAPTSVPMPNPVTCRAVPGNSHNVSDAQCAFACAALPTGMWPCTNTSVLCDCSPHCRAVPGNMGGATDEACKNSCALLDGMWPCDNSGLCDCPSSPTPEPTPPATTPSPTSTTLSAAPLSATTLSAAPTQGPTQPPTTLSPGCDLPGVAELVEPFRDFLSRAVVKPGEPLVDPNNAMNNEPNVQKVMRVLPKEKFDWFFARANYAKGPGEEHGPYGYTNFLKAIWKFPYFCGEPDQTDDNCKLELASSFAQYPREVGENNPWVAEHTGIPIWRQGLNIYAEACGLAGTCEYTGPSCSESTWQGQKWPCATGKNYYGRGAKQLSWNYNYGPFSQAMFGDANYILQNPDLLTTTWLALASAYWFYMTPQPPKPSMHDVVVGRWLPTEADKAAGRLPGFGVLTMIINGAIECSKGAETNNAQERADHFKNFADDFGVSYSGPLGCGAMQPFDTGNTAVYWAQDWTKAGACKLVSWVSPCNMLDFPADPAMSYCACDHYRCTSSPASSIQ